MCAAGPPQALTGQLPSKPSPPVSMSMLPSPGTLSLLYSLSSSLLASFSSSFKHKYPVLCS